MTPVIRFIVATLTQPLLLAALALIAAGVLARRGRRRAARGFAIASAAVVYLGSLTPVADALMGPLERRYPALNAAAGASGGPPGGAVCVVVLGSGYLPREDVPITAQLDEAGLTRIVEAMRLARLYHLPLLVSGGQSGFDGAPALGYAQLARDIGFDDTELSLSPVGTNTAGEGKELARRLGVKPFLLVTSAAHMPRAMAVLRRAGAKPVAAPTGQQVVPASLIGPRRLLPNAMALRKVELALHEYLGLAAMGLGWE